MKFKSLLWNFLKRLSSLSISIVLLLIISIFSIIGTIIEQDQSIEYYKLNYPMDRPIFFFFTWKQIINWHLNHVYSNFVFVLLLLLFFISLLVCTVSKQLPILKRSRQWKFLYNKSSLKKFINLSIIPRESFINFVYILNLKHYYIFHKGNAIYAYKGLLGRIAPIFVHFSIILTLLGSFIGLLGGFFIQEMIPVGEIFHFQNIVKSGYISNYHSNLLGKVNSLNIAYNQDSSIQQFFSSLSLLDNRGKTLCNKIVSVNKPLKFRGLTFYQTDWQVNALRFQIGSKYFCEKSLNKIKSKNNVDISWFCSLMIDNNQISIFIIDLSNDIVIYDSDGILIVNTSYGMCNVIYGVPIIIQHLMTGTGLQVKTDPGIYLIYVGFLVLIVSIVTSYQSYSQVWANSNNNKLYCNGFTNRASLLFEEEIVLISKAYITLLRTGH